MRIINNIMAMDTYRHYSINNLNVSKSVQKLSSGLRINSAADDSAGLAISEKMRAQIRGLNMASKNSQDGISLLQSAEGALSETQSILQRMRELAVQSSSDTNGSIDRNAIQAEVNQLAMEITDISNQTEFNGKKLLNGALTAGGTGNLTLQTGANEGETLDLSIGAMDAATLGVSGNVGTATTTTASGTVNSAAATVASATFSGSLGSKIIDGATLTLAYSSNAVTISDGTPADDQIVTLNAADTSFTVSSGNFKGLTVNLASGKTVSDLTSGDGVLVRVSPTATGAVTGGTGGTTTLQKTDGANVTSSVTGTPSFTADGEDITLTYTQGTPGNPGTPATKAGFVFLKSFAADLKTQLSPTSDAQFTISIDGIQQATITAAQMRGYNSGAGVQVGTDMYSLIYPKVPAGTMWLDNPPNPNWGMHSPDKGTSASVEVNVTGSSASERSAIESFFGMTTDDKIVYGTNTGSTPGTPSTVTIADGGGNSATVTVGDWDTSFSGSGYFSGLSVNLASGKALWNLDGGSASKISFANVTGPGTSSVVGSVSFGSSLGSKITNGANLTFTYSAGNVTISDGNSADNQTIAVNAAGTSFTVGSGNYKGMTVNLASGKTVSGLTSGTDGAAISLSAPTATGTATAATANVASVSFGSDLGSMITNGANLTFTYSASNITISDGSPANDQTIATNATATSFTVGSGNYQGLTVNLAPGKMSSDLTSGNDGITVSVSTTTTATGAAQFTNHVLTSNASCSSGIDVTTHAAASAAITAINTAINTVSTQRAYLGAFENRLTFKMNNLDTASENLSAAESRISDVDMAQEMTEYTKNNILVQAATAMLAQANQSPQNVLKLLQ